MWMGSPGLSPGSYSSQESHPSQLTARAEGKILKARGKASLGWEQGAVLVSLRAL